MRGLELGRVGSFISSTLTNRVIKFIYSYPFILASPLSELGAAHLDGFHGFPLCFQAFSWDLRNKSISCIQL